MRSIAIKLWGGMMALAAVVLIMLWLFQIVFLNNFYTKMRIDEISDSGLEIINELGSLEELENTLDEFAYNNNLTAELIDSDYNTIYTTGSAGTGGQMPMMKNGARKAAYEKAMQAESSFISMTHPRFGSKFMLIGLPMIASGKIEGALIITLPLAPVDATVDILKKQLVYITIILFVMSLLISYLLSRSFIRPILEIIRVSKDMASGDLSVRIKSKRKDEIGRLAETINYLGVELSKIDQLKKDLIANVSHELRTPLSLIKGYAETIRDVSGENKDKREKQIGIIIEEADRLSSIVEDILKLSQMQAGYIDLNIERFSLNETLERVVKRYEILSEKRKVKILLSYCGEPIVQGDTGKIEQVLYNLLNNAFNHAPEESTIYVATFDTDNKIRIEITDTGEGIAEGELLNIWDRFYKAGGSGKRNGAGTGLGLAIVKSILNAHGALYGVKSQIGKGTTFWLELKKCEQI